MTCLSLTTGKQVFLLLWLNDLERDVSDAAVSQVWGNYNFPFTL